MTVMTETREETNKALVEQVFEIYNTHDVAALDPFFVHDVVHHDAPPGIPPGLEGLKLDLSGGFAAFPDMRVEAEHVIADGDMVAILWRSHGTHTGPLMDIPPSGKEVATTGAVVYRIVGGKIVEVWFKSNALDMLQQIGAVPAPAG
jgi:predicted ester cyclase